MSSARTVDQIDDDRHGNLTHQPEATDELIDDLPLASDDTPDDVRGGAAHAQPWLDWGNS